MVYMQLCICKSCVLRALLYFGNQYFGNWSFRQSVFWQSVFRQSAFWQLPFRQSVFWQLPFRQSVFGQLDIRQSVFWQSINFGNDLQLLLWKIYGKLVQFTLTMLSETHIFSSLQIYYGAYQTTIKQLGTREKQRMS